MDERAALNLLKAAIRKKDAAEARAEEAKTQLYEVIKYLSACGLKQIRIAEATKWSREHIRNIVDGKTPRRPTPKDES